MTRATAAELAVHLRTSTRQVQRYVAAGMPYIPTGARGKVYDVAACEQWLIDNPTALCRSDKTKKAAGTSSSVSTGGAYIAACQQVRVRATPSSSTLNFAPPLRVIARR